MLELSIASQENLVLLALALIAQIPIAIQDMKARSLPPRSWLRVSVTVAIIVGALGVINRLRLHESWHNTTVSVVVAIIWAMLVGLFWLTSPKSIGASDVRYYFACLVPLALCTTPIWVMLVLCLAFPTGYVVAKFQRGSGRPLITGCVGAGFMAIAAILFMIH